MIRAHHTLLVVAPLLGALANTSCKTNPVVPRQRAAPVPRLVLHEAPRVRAGRVLRLRRAGQLLPQRVGTQQVMTAYVPARYRAPRWQRGIDSQGNLFRIGPQGRLVAPGQPRADREPASVDNVAYYYTQSFALMAARYRRQGLLMALEVLDLPDGDVHVARAKAGICQVLGRLGLRGEVLERVYANVVAVEHIEGGKRQVINHVDRFALTAPTDWPMLAGKLPGKGRRGRALVFSIPTTSAPGDAGDGKVTPRANLIWSVIPSPTEAVMQSLVARDRAALRQKNADIRPWRDGPTGPGIRAFVAGPITFKGRAFRSFRVYLHREGRAHALNLLVATETSATPLFAPLRAMVASLRPPTARRRCEAAR